MTHFNYSSQLTNHLRSANCIGSVMVSVLTCMVVDRGFESDRFKPKTMKLVFVESPLNIQHLGDRPKTRWLVIRIINILM